MEPNKSEDSPDRMARLERRRRQDDLRRGVRVALLLIVVSSFAYLLSRPSSSKRRVDVVGAVADNRDDVTIRLSTSNPLEISEYIDDEWGLRVDVPLIEGASLAGASSWRPMRGLELPAVSYHDPDGGVSVVFVLNYASLDRLSDRIRLESALQKELEDDRSFTVLNAGDQREVVLWRKGDDIYITVAPNGASDLISRITP